MQTIQRLKPIVWSDSDGDLVMSLNGLASTALRIGARHDLGAGHTPLDFAWRAVVQFEAAPVPGEAIQIYGCSSDGTYEDGGVGAIDAAVTLAELANLTQIGALTVTTNTADHDMIASGVVRIVSRYWSPVLYNATVTQMAAHANVSRFILTPLVRGPRG